MSIQKTELFLTFDHETLLELKRVLFKEGITATQFFNYVAEKLIVCDPRLTEILSEARSYKKQKMLEGKIPKLSPEIIYDLIQDELDKNK